MLKNYACFISHLQNNTFSQQWFPATVTRYNSTTNQVLLSYEDEDEKWHTVDSASSDLAKSLLDPDFEGTFDKNSIKYRVLAFAMEGEGAVRKFGDESDYEVEDGTSFPAVPPALPASRLPKLISNTNVSYNGDHLGLALEIKDSYWLSVSVAIRF